MQQDFFGVKKKEIGASARYDKQKGLRWLKYLKMACFTNHTVACTSLALQPQNVSKLSSVLWMDAGPSPECLVEQKSPQI